MVSSDYTDVERLIHSICWKFVNKFNMDFDDCLSEAGEAYLRAEDSYDPDKSTSFTTHVYNCVHNALQTLVKRRRQMRSRMTSTMPDVDTDKRVSGVSLGAIVSNLSVDAAEVVEMILDTGSVVRKGFGRKQQKGRLEVIRNYLWNREDWSMDHVTEVFSELREVFS